MIGSPPASALAATRRGTAGEVPFRRPMCRRDAGARDAARVTETHDAWDDAMIHAEAEVSRRRPAAVR